MKTIGLIGGTGWVSTLEYYKLINETVNRKLGGLQFPKIILYSVNYGEIYACNQNKNREGVYQIIKSGVDVLEKGGADFVALCANTIHFTYPQLKKNVQLPFVHIADATGNEINKRGLKKVALLGTRETMEMDFYTSRLAHMGIEVITPVKAHRDYIHNTIMNELLLKQFHPKTKAGYLSIMEEMKNDGADGIILGCTEIPLLVKQTDTKLPLFNTLQIHAKAIVEFALK